MLALQPVLLTDLITSSSTHLDAGQWQMGGVEYREDVDHICRLYFLLEQQHKHLILLNKFGSSSKNLAVQAGVLADCQVHLIDISMPDSTYRELMKAIYINVSPV